VKDLVSDPRVINFQSHFLKKLDQEGLRVFGECHNGNRWKDIEVS